MKKLTEIELNAEKNKTSEYDSDIKLTLIQQNQLLNKSSGDLKAEYDKHIGKSRKIRIFTDPKDPLSDAIGKGDLDYVKDYIEKRKKSGKSIPARTKHNVPHILIAAINYKTDNHLKIIDVFINEGLSVDDDFQGVTCIQEAICRKDTKFIDFLLSKNINLKQTNIVKNNLLQYALIEFPITYLVDKLITLGVDVNHKNIDGITPLMLAAQHLVLVKKLLEIPHIDFQAKEIMGNNVLHAAVGYTCDGFGSICKKCKAFLVVDSLIKKGVICDEPGLSRIKFVCDSHFGITKNITYLGTPLIAAVLYGHHLVVKRLLKEKINVNTWYGMPLFLAAYYGYLIIVKELLAAGAKLDSYVPELGTALIGATVTARYEIVEFLLEKGANMMVPLPDLKEDLFHAVMNSKFEKLQRIFLKEFIKRDLRIQFSEQESLKNDKLKEELNNLLELLVICLLQVKIEIKNDDTIFQFNVKQYLNLLLLIEPRLLNTNTICLTLSREVANKIFLDFITNPKIIKLVKKSESVLKNINNFSDLKNVDGVIKVLMTAFWQHSKERILFENFEKKDKLINLKRSLLNFQEKTHKMYKQFVKLLEENEIITTNIDNNLISFRSRLQNSEIEKAELLKIEQELNAIRPEETQILLHKNNVQFLDHYKTASTQITHLYSLTASEENELVLKDHLEQVEKIYQQLESYFNVSLKFSQDVIKIDENINSFLQKKSKHVLQQELSDSVTNNKIYNTNSEVNINTSENNEDAKNKKDKIKTKKPQKTTEITNEFKLKKQQAREERQAELASFMLLENKDNINKINEQKLALEKLIEEDKRLKESKKMLNLEYLEKRSLNKPVTLLVQYKGKVDEELELLKEEQEPMDSLETQLMALKKVLNFINSLPPQSSLLPKELVIFRYSLMYCIAIVGESVYQARENSIFSNHLRNFLFGYSDDLFPELEYKKIDEYIKLNQELIDMVKQMIKVATNGNNNNANAQIASPLYDKIMQHKLDAEGRDYNYYLQQISRDEDTLFRINEYRKEGGCFNKNPDTLELAIRFTIGRMGKNAKCLKDINPGIYEILNFFNKRLDKFRTQGNSYRHIASLNDCLSNFTNSSILNSVSSKSDINNTSRIVMSNVSDVSKEKSSSDVINDKSNNFTL